MLKGYMTGSDHDGQPMVAAVVSTPSDSVLHYVGSFLIRFYHAT